MVKTVTKIGNSQGIIFDTALLDLTQLKPGDEVNITVHEGGTIVITPLKPRLDPEKVKSEISKVIEDYSETLRKLK